MFACAALSRAETITGVVYSKEAGNGAHPSGSIELAVNEAIRPMIWPVLEDRSKPGCADVGAIWTVKTTGSPSLPEIIRVTCRGVDKEARDAWLLVHTFMEGIPGSVNRSPSLSPRYRASSEFYLFTQQSQDFLFSTSANPVRIISLRSSRARLEALGTDLYGTAGRLISLTFELVRDKRTADWQIDRIDVRAK
jgi:hypothetical protein